MLRHFDVTVSMKVSSMTEINTRVPEANPCPRVEYENWKNEGVGITVTL
jgi:hypothetical protein